MQHSQVYKIIIFEGPDCSGKTTLKRAFEKDTNYKHLCIDRMFVTSLVYNKIFDRNIIYNVKILEDLKKFSREFDVIFVYMSTTVSTTWRRIKNRGDDMIESKKNLLLVNRAYDKVFSDLENELNVIRINETYNVEAAIERIKDGIC